MTSKFRGKYLEVIPTGLSHVLFKTSGDHYTFTKVPTTVNNIIVGKLWCDQHGTMIINNHNNGDTCQLKYSAYSIFSSSEQRKVVGTIADSAGFLHYAMEGTWDAKMEYWSPARPDNRTVAWSRNPIVPCADKMYGFTDFAVQMNELTAIDEGCCRTDARLRPDIREMEQGLWDEANKTKEALEEAQRARRKDMEKKTPGVATRMVHCET